MKTQKENYPNLDLHRQLRQGMINAQTMMEVQRVLFTTNPTANEIEEHFRAQQVERTFRDNTRRFTPGRWTPFTDTHIDIETPVPTTLGEEEPDED